MRYSLCTAASNRKTIIFHNFSHTASWFAHCNKQLQVPTWNWWPNSSFYHGHHRLEKQNCSNVNLSFYNNNSQQLWQKEIQQNNQAPQWHRRSWPRTCTLFQKREKKKRKTCNCKNKPTLCVVNSFSMESLCAHHCNYLQHATLQQFFITFQTFLLLTRCKSLAHSIVSAFAWNDFAIERLREKKRNQKESFFFLEKEKL